jgi:hypothetical protein
MFVIPLCMRIRMFLDFKEEWERTRIALAEAQIDFTAAGARLKLAQEGPSGFSNPLRKRRRMS